MAAKSLCWMPRSIGISFTSSCLSGFTHGYRVPSHAMLPGLTFARLRRAALVLPGVTGTKKLGSHHHCVRGRCSLELAVQLVPLVGANIWAVYRAEVLCVAAPHLQQPLWTMNGTHVGLQAQSG